MRSSVSFVDISPSIVILLKDFLTESFTRRSSVSLSMAMSVMRKQSIVAI